MLLTVLLGIVICETTGKECSSDGSLCCFWGGYSSKWLQTCQVKVYGSLYIRNGDESVVPLSRRDLQQLSSSSVNSRRRLRDSRRLEIPQAANDRQRRKAQRISRGWESQDAKGQGPFRGRDLTRRNRGMGNGEVEASYDTRGKGIYLRASDGKAII